MIAQVKNTDPLYLLVLGGRIAATFPDAGSLVDYVGPGGTGSVSVVRVPLNGTTDGVLVQDLGPTADFVRDYHRTLSRFG
jgi:hypothetical protein